MDHAFQITGFIVEDARDLSDLMQANQNRFRRFLPQTLAQNLSTTDSEAYIIKKKVAWENRSEFTYALREPSQNKVVGLVMIKKIDWEQKTAELAYGIGKVYAGQGWMSRTIKRIAAISFKELHLQTLHIVAHHSNFASIAVAHKCGFRWEKTLPKEHTVPGEAVLDMELYVLHSSDRQNN